MRDYGPVTKTLLISSGGQTLLSHLSMDILFSEISTTIVRSLVAGIRIKVPAVVFNVFMDPLPQYFPVIVLTLHTQQAA